MDFGVVLVWICVHGGCLCVCCVWKEKDVWVINSEWSYSSRESGKERVWRMRKEGENDFEGKERLFALCDCVFHPHPPPFQSIIPQLFFLRSHSHTTPHKHVCVLSSFFLRAWLSVHSFHTQSTQHHAIMQHYTRHNQQVMKWGNMKEQWLRTPSTTMKSWWHSLHLVSLVAWIGHAHSSQHHRGTTEVKWQEERSSWRKSVDTRKEVPLLCGCLTSHKPFTSYLKAKKEELQKEKKNCYGHTKRKAPLLVWSVKLSLFGPG